MHSGRRWPLYCAALLLAARAQAEDKPQAKAEPAVDAEFLEYLGSVESKEENWTDFDSSEKAHETKVVAKPESKAEAQSKPAEQTQASDSSKAKTQ